MGLGGKIGEFGLTFAVDLRLAEKAKGVDGR